MRAALGVALFALTAPAVLAAALQQPSRMSAPHRHLSPLASSVDDPPVAIKVIGIGGGGSNAVNRMVEALGAHFAASTPPTSTNSCHGSTRPASAALELAGSRS